VTPGKRRQTVLLALGSNLDAPLERLRWAASGLRLALNEVAASGVYRTPPEGGAAQPFYLNAVVRAKTDMTPREVLALAQALEDRAGRSRPYPGAPRTLDVDLLFVGDAVVAEADLEIPHPRWDARDFVVVPLLDVAPGWRDPRSGRTVWEVAHAAGWSADRFDRVLGPDELLESGAAR
jgi:2-amino-4-hydroxy-6-hydroxymethyldihydropteridine diphosphokinase